MRSGGQAATLIDACTRGAGRGSDGVSASPVSRFRLCSPALSSFSHRNLLATARLIKAKPAPPSYQPPSVHPTETPSQAISSRRSMAEASLEPNSELLAGTGLEGHVRFGPAGFEDLMGTTLSLRHSLPAPPFCLRAVMQVARPTADQEPCPVLFFLSSTVSDKCPEGLEEVCRFQCCVPSTCDSTADEACVPVRACVCARVWVPHGKMPPSSVSRTGTYGEEAQSGEKW